MNPVEGTEPPERPGNRDADWRLRNGALFDVNDLLDAVRHRWLRVLLATLAGGALGLALSFAFARVYRAEVLVELMDIEKSIGTAQRLRDQFGGLASLVGFELPGSGEKEAVLAYLSAPGFTASFIEDLGLRPILFENDWDAAEKKWRSSDPEDQPTLDDAIELFDEDVREVERDKITGLVALRVKWKDPQRAADWANQLVDRANAMVRENARREAQKSIEYLNGELDKTTVIERREFIFRLLEEQTQRIMFANVRDDYAFRVIDRARPPDADRFYFPNRPLFAFIGVIFGLLTGLVLAVMANRRNRS